MAHLKGLKDIAARLIRHWGFWVAIATVAGLLLGNVTFNGFIGQPNVGVVKIDVSLYPWTAPKIVQMLKYVEENDAIKAVVLQVDCPGGDAVSTEELYLHIVKLRNKKPVVVSVDIVSASGGYYISTAANFIYAKASSTLGSVGAFVSLPEREQAIQDIITTGPYKATGSSIGEFATRLEMLKQGFLGAVSAQRGERLKISKEELSKAGLYNGIQAVRYGLIDEIGSRSDAIVKAAELAGLRNYGTIDINDKLRVSLISWYLHAPSSGNQSLELQGGAVPLYYFLYVPPDGR